MFWVLRICNRYVINFLFISETTAYAVRKRNGNALDATTRISDVKRIFIISIGSFTSFLLILIIVLEIYQYRRLPTPTVVSPSHEEMNENNCVSGENVFV